MPRARATMMRWPFLWMPPILVNLFQSMASVPMASQSMQWIVLACAYMASFIIDAGWLQMIGRAQKDQAPKFSDFNAGVNAHWGHLVAGHLVYFLLIGGFMAAIAWYGDQQYGFVPLKSWYDAMMALKPTELQAALEPSKIPVPVRGWMSLMTVWMAGVAALTFLLLFWQPLTVLTRLPWWKAWGASVRLVFKRFFQVLGYALLHVAAFSLALSIAASGTALLAVVGLTMLLFVTIYFKILYAAVVADEHPEAVLAEFSTEPPPVS
jgi:hypothetical protein